MLATPGARCARRRPGTGTHSLTAVYQGDKINSPSTSAVLSQVINAGSQAPSSTAVASSQNPSTVGASITFTATVTGSNPTGTVNFQDGAGSIAGCAAQALSGSGNTRTAQCTTASLSPGAHNISGAYGGDAGNTASTSPVLVQTVNPATGSTTLASSANPATAGIAVTFTATVSGVNPTGTVNFKDNGVSIAGCGALVLTGSGNTKTAQCSTSSLSVGSHPIVATYSGDGSNVSTSSAQLSQVINAAGAGSSTTTLSSSANPVFPGFAVTITATVVGANPTGVVDFKDNGVLDCRMQRAAARRLRQHPDRAVHDIGIDDGIPSVTGVYGGDSANAPSTSRAQPGRRQGLTGHERGGAHGAHRHASSNAERRKPSSVRGIACATRVLMSTGSRTVVSPWRTRSTSRAMRSAIVFSSVATSVSPSSSVSRRQRLIQRAALVPQVHHVGPARRLVARERVRPWPLADATGARHGDGAELGNSRGEAAQELRSDHLAVARRVRRGARLTGHGKPVASVRRKRIDRRGLRPPLAQDRKSDLTMGSREMIPEPAGVVNLPSAVVAICTSPSGRNDVPRVQPRHAAPIEVAVEGDALCARAASRGTCGSAGSPCTARSGSGRWRACCSVFSTSGPKLPVDHRADVGPRRGTAARAPWRSSTNWWK